MKTILLYGHGGACNHGAEAIVRTTVPRLRRPGNRILLSTHFPEQDRAFGLDRLVDELIPADLSWAPQERAAGTLEEKEAFARRIYRDALARIDSETVCVGIGGDNYCYPNWHRQSLFHKTAKARGGVSLLWCCSIQPEAIDDAMAAVLAGHDHIYARESVTYEALLAHGIRQVTLTPDPAFALAPESLPLPDGFCPGATAALNLSPLVLRQSPGLLEHVAAAARVLLERVESLLLLPHVTMPMDDDREALEALAARLPIGLRGRLCRPAGPLNAAQAKHLISQCVLLVCSRTHASIAGYSSFVPTLVAGYSVKSQGIGRDLGMERWVIPLGKAAGLPEAAAALWAERETVKGTLAHVIPAYGQSLTRPLSF